MLKSPAILFAFVAIAGITLANGQMGMPGMKKKDHKPIKADLKHVKCGVCKAAAREMHEQQKALRLSNGKIKGGEEAVMPIVENICNPKEKEGQWTARFDLSFDKAAETIALLDQGGIGHCKRECQTIAKSCADLIEDLDVDDLQVALWKGISADKLSSKLCTKWSSACKKKQPKLKERKFDEEFQKKTKKDIEMDELMANMQGMPGMGGMQMFSRDDIEENLANLKDEM